MAAITPVPSTSFTAILRRSKFASFDPAIAQVYTTHGGDAHRGNWGLKRPLPNRRRGGMITVSAVDSAHQQTEWKSGEPQARWAMQFRELGRDAPANSRGDWNKRTGQAALVWEIDSEYARLDDGVKPIDSGYARREDGAKLINSDYVRLEDGAELIEEEKPDEFVEASNNPPNAAAMTDVQFLKYERKLRALRGEFRDFIEKYAKESTSAGDARSPHSPQSENAVRMFLQQQAGKDYASSKRNGLIEQKPHPRAGLSYAHVSAMQAYFASDALPGRIFGQAPFNPATTLRGTLYAGFAGMRVFLEQRHSEGLRQARPGQPPTQTRFRVESAQLERAPSVVGRSQTALNGTALNVFVQSWSEHEQLRMNPHMPGSREWVGHQAPPAMTQGKLLQGQLAFFGGARAATQMGAPPPPPRTVSNEDIVASLRALIARNK